MRGHLSLALPLALLAAPAAARVDYIEVAFGASNLAAIEGNGRLTVGVSPDGDIPLVSWPSPSYFEQVHALQANGIGARDLPRMGLHDGMGIFAGLVLERAGALEVTRLHDPEWRREVRYARDDVSVVETVFTHEEPGLTVTQRDSVQPDGDVLVRRYVVERGVDSDVTAAWLLAYQNLSPGLSKLPKVPMADVLIDHKNDFLAAWDAERELLVQFHPGDTGVVDALLPALGEIPRDFGALGALLASDVLDEDALDALLTDLDASYAPGVYAVAATVPAPEEIQVGTDATDTCGAIDDWIANIQLLPELIPDEPLPVGVNELDRARCGTFRPVEDVYAAEGWLWRPEDALEDALDDGHLEGSRLAGAQANAAFKVPLVFAVTSDGEERAEATLLLAFGGTHAEALATLDAARDEAPDALEARALEEDQAFSAGLALPEGVSEHLVRFSLRTLLNLRVGTDAATGAIVASVSRQPPYQLDWPRDGAFFNVALDLSGQAELVTRRMDFYSAVIRDEESAAVPLIEQPVPGWPDCEGCTGYPPDSWEMNYYADGEVGGNIRLEIDNTALLVWAYAFHAGHLEEPERTAYLERVYPTVTRAADFVAEWKDDTNNLVFFANEDDNAAFTQGLQGAVTVFGALVSAARIAKALGDDDAVDRWTSRAGELREALLEHMYDEEKGFLARPASPREPDPPASRGGPSAWLVWPAHVLPYDDERVQAQLLRGLDAAMPKVRGEGEGAGYTTKVAVSAALALKGEARQLTLEMAERLAGMGGETLQLGEVFVNVDDDGDGATDRQVSSTAPPHLWAATLVYLTAMAYSHPERFDAYLDALPDVHVPGDPLPEPPPEGCGCESAKATPGSAPGIAFVILLALLRARRRIS